MLYLCGDVDATSVHPFRFSPRGAVWHAGQAVACCDEHGRHAAGWRAAAFEAVTIARIKRVRGELTSQALDPWVELRACGKLDAAPLLAAKITALAPQKTHLQHTNQAL